MNGIGLGLGFTSGKYDGSVRVSAPGFIVTEGAATGTTVGTLSVINGTGTWTFTETVDPDNKFTVASNGVVTTSAAIDYETATTHSLSVSATNGTDIVTKTVTVGVVNVPEVTLSVVTLDDTSHEEDGARVTNIVGATSGSTFTVSAGALPSGMVLDSAARTISGTPTTAQTANFTLTQSHPDAVNVDSPLSITITAAAEGSASFGDIAATDNVLVLPLGQSNAATANTDAAMAATQFGTPWTALHRQWVVSANAWQSYVPGVNSNTEGTATGEAWSWEAVIAAARAGLGHTGKTDIVKEAVSGNGMDPKYNNGNWYPGGTHPEGYTPDSPGTRVTGLEAQLTAAFAANAAAGGVTYNRIKITWTQGEKDLDALGSAINYRVIFGALVQRLRANSLFTGVPIDFLIIRIRPTNSTAETERHLRGSILRNGAYLAMTTDLPTAGLTVGMVNVDDCGVGYPENDGNIHPASGNPAWMYQSCDRVEAYYDGSYTATYGDIDANDPGVIANLADTTAVVGTAAVSASFNVDERIEQRTTVTLPAGIEAQLLAFNDDVVADWSSSLNWIDKYLKIRFRYNGHTSSSDETKTLQIGSRSFTWRVIGAPAVDYRADTDTYIAALATAGGTALSPTQAGLLDTFYASGATQGWMAKLDSLHIDLGSQIAFNLAVNNPAVVANASAGANPFPYALGTGYQSTSTGQKMEMLAATSVGQDTVGMGVWLHSVGDSTNYIITNFAGDVRLNVRNTGATSRQLNQGSVTTSTVTTGAGFWHGNRVDAANTQLYGPAGTELATSAAASATPTTGSFFLTGGTNGTHAQVRGAWLSDGFSATDVQNFRNALATLMAGF